MSREADVALTEVWLRHKGVTLWGDYTITDPARRRLAAEWFVDQLTSRDKFISDYVMNRVADL